MRALLILIALLFPTLANAQMDGPAGTFPAPKLFAPNNFTNTQTVTLNSLTSQTLQDALTSADKLTFGVSASANCDPGALGIIVSGPCAQINLTPNVVGSWQTLTIQGTNSRVILAATDGGAENPELICSGINTQGVPVWIGGPGFTQSGCGTTGFARINAGSPFNFNVTNLGNSPTSLTASSATSSGGRSTLTVTAQSGTSLVIGTTISDNGVHIPANTKIVGNSTTNAGFCSPNCTGAGGTGTYSIGTVTGTVVSETMVGAPSGAEGSTNLNIYGGSQDGLTQNGVFIYNANCSYWAASCSGAPAGSRYGEIAGFGMSGSDGLITQTELWSWNGYAALSCSGTHTDGSYTCPTNMVLRLAPNTANPERLVAVFDYAANLFLGTSWTTTTASGSPGGALFVGNTMPANAGLLNSVYAPNSQQGLTIQNVGGDTGDGHAVLFSRTDGTTEGSIVISASGTAFNTTSDRRLKTGIVPTSEDEVGGLIDQLQVVDFKFRDDLTKSYIGFIAQDEYAVFPDAISKGDDTDAQPGDAGFRAWGRDDSKLVPLLVREVQALRQRVSRLESLH